MGEHSRMANPRRKRPTKEVRAMGSSAWRSLRAKALAELDPTCCLCGREVDVTLPGTDPWGPSIHHLVPRSLGSNVIVPLDQLAIVHARCNSSHGATLRNRPRARASVRDPDQQTLAGFFLPDAGDAAHVGGIPPHHSGPAAEPRWSQAKVDDLVAKADELAESFTPARLETCAQSDVAGTYGDLAAAWADYHFGITLWPWQLHALRRALEYREDGTLRWRTVIVSTARQSGKSVLLRVLMSWRLAAADVFGEPQAILHVASNRQIARTVWQAAAREWQARVPEARVRWANGQEAVELDDGSVWEVLAPNLHVVGRSISLAVVDEAFDVDEAVVEAGIIPTMLQRKSAQLWLVSTAGDSTSQLMAAYRNRAIASIDDPDGAGVLLLEWSAPPGADPMDPESWRQASPQWDAHRAELIAERAKLTDEVAFRSQFLNAWTTGSSRAWLTEANVIDAESDRPLPDVRVEPGTIAVERGTDDGRALTPYGIVLVVRDQDGDAVVRSWTESTDEAAFLRLEQLAAERRGVTIMHHEAVRIPHVKGARMRVVKGYHDQYAGYAAARGAFLDGTIHLAPGQDALREHLLMANTYQSPEGRVMLSTRASEGPIYLARALVWACSDQLRHDRPGKPLIAAM